MSKSFGTKGCGMSLKLVSTPGFKAAFSCPKAWEGGGNGL
jgi:hypothetical protein